MKLEPRVATLALTAAAFCAVLCWLAPWGGATPSPTAVGAANTPQAARAERDGSGDARAGRLPVGESERAAYAAPVGSRLRFASRGHSHNRITNIEGVDGGEVKVDWHGELVVDVVARRADELVVRVAMPNLSMTATSGGRSHAPDELRSALAGPALVRMGDDGSIRGYRFADAQRGESRNWLRSIVAALWFTVEDDLESWERDEPDATGIARVRYRRGTDRVLHKAKLSYRPVDGEPAPRVTGAGSATHDPELGWLVSSQYREQIELALPEAGVAVVVRFDTDCRLIDHSEVDTAAFDWDGAWSCARGDTDTPQEDAGHDAWLAEQVRGARADQLAGELVALLQSKDFDEAAAYDLRARLVVLVRIEPESLGQLADWLADPAIDPQSAAEVLAAIGAAGTEPAQQFLADVLVDGAAATHQRLSAVRSLFQIERLGAAALEAVRSVAVDPRSDALLAGTSVLALGAFANGGTDAQWQQLVTLEDGAAARGLTGHWLEALGNAGHPDAVAASRRYRDDPDPELRAAAAGAIRSVHTDAAMDLLIGLSEGDASSSVRRVALAILGDRDDPRARARVENALLHDSAAAVRQAAVLAIADRVSADPQARALVEQVARSDESAELRELAQRILAGVRGS